MRARCAGAGSALVVLCWIPVTFINISGIWSAIIVNLMKILNYPEIAKCCVHHLRVLLCVSFRKSMDRLKTKMTTYTMICYYINYLSLNWFKQHLELCCDDCWNNETSSAGHLLYTWVISSYTYTTRYITHDRKTIAST